MVAPTFNWHNLPLDATHELAKYRARPGRVVAVGDVDGRGHFAEPACAALDRFVDLYSATVRRRGADPNIGPRLPALLHRAGFTPSSWSA